MATVEVERSVLENLYKALHWYVSRESDYRMVTENILSDMNEVATILYDKKDEDNYVNLVKNCAHPQYVWGKMENFVVYKFDKRFLC